MPQISHIAGSTEPCRTAERVGPETIQAMLDRLEWRFQGMPTISVIWKNDPEFLAEWPKGRPIFLEERPVLVIDEDYEVVFESRLQGGNSTFAIGAMIAVAVAAALVAGPLAVPAAGLFGIAASASIAGLGAGSAASIFGAVAGVGIALGGSLLVNAFLMPKPATEAGFNDDPPPSLVNARGNTARPLEAIEHHYGRRKVWPSIAAPSYSEFHNGKQRVNIFLCLGIGEYEIERMYFDDTQFWYDGDIDGAFDESIKVEVVNPGEETRLFPAGGYALAVEVDSLLIPGAGSEGNWGNDVGPFILNDWDAPVTKLVWDISLPGGCYKYNSDNEPKTRTTKVRGYYRTIAEDGSPISGWQLGFEKEISRRSREAINLSFEKDVDVDGRYESYVERRDKELDPEDGADTMIWFQFRGRLKAPDTFDDVTCIAIQIDVDDQEIASTVQNRVGVVATRKVWVAKSGDTWDFETSKSPIWAAVDVWSNPHLCNRDRDAIDREVLKYYAEQADGRGDEFNHQFTTDGAAWEVLQTCLKVMRTRAIIIGSNLSVIRDEPRAVPTMMISDREIVKGSVKIDYVTQDEDTADDVILEFINESTWEIDEVRATLKDSNSEKPVRVRVDGITNFSHAWREARYLAAVNRGRRVYPEVLTEHDGRTCKFGDLIRLNSEIPEWGQSSAVIGWKSADRRLTVDPPPNWTGGQWYVELRAYDGRRFGPVRCSKGSRENIAILNFTHLAEIETEQGISFSQVMRRGKGADLPTAVFGEENKLAVDAVVMAIERMGNQTRVKMVLDDPRVHTVDGTEVEPTPNQPPVKPPNKPVLLGLKAKLSQRDNDTTLDVSWLETFGARKYIVQVSSDEDGTPDDDRSWTRFYAGTGFQHDASVDRVATRVRAAAIGKLRGQWIYQDVAAPAYLSKVPTLTVTPFIQTGGRKDRGPGLRVSWAKALDHRYEGIVIQWWPTADDTRVRTKVIRSKSRTQTEIFEGIQRETEYSVNAYYLFKGGLEGVVGDTETETTGATFSAADAPTPALTVTSVVRPASGDKQRAALGVSWSLNSMKWPTSGDPVDPRINGIEFRYRVSGEGGTEWQYDLRRINDSTDRDFRIFKGIRAGSTYEYQARFAFDDGNLGSWTTNSPLPTHTVNAVFDAGTAPVPDVAGATITASTQGGDGGTQRAFFKIAIPSNADARIRGVLFEYKKDGEADAEAVQKFFRGYTSIRLAEGIQKRTEYSIRAAFVFDGEYTGNFSSWRTDIAANDYLADPPDDAGADNELANWSFERADASTSTGAMGWTHETGSGWTRATGHAEHGDYALGRSGTGNSAIEPVPERRLETRNNNRFNAIAQFKRDGTVTFDALGVRIVFRTKAGSVTFSGTAITSVGTSYVEVEVKDVAAPSDAFSVSVRVYCTNQAGAGTLWVDSVSLRRQAFGRDLASDIALPPNATAGTTGKKITDPHEILKLDSAKLIYPRNVALTNDDLETDTIGTLLVGTTGSRRLKADKMLLGTTAGDPTLDSLTEGSDRSRLKGTLKAGTAVGAADLTTIDTRAEDPLAQGNTKATKLKGSLARVGDNASDETLDTMFEGSVGAKVIKQTKVRVGTGSRVLSDNTDAAGRIKMDGVADDAIEDAKIKSKNLNIRHLANESTVSMDVDIETAEINITPGENNQSFAVVTISCRKGSKVLLSGTALMRSQSGGDTSTDVEIVCVTDSNRVVQKWGSVGNTQLRVSHAFITMDSPPGSLFGGGDDDVANIQYRLRGTSVSGLVNTLITDRSLVAQNAKQAT